MKITDENSISVAGSPSVIGSSAANMLGRCSEEAVGWWPQVDALTYHLTEKSSPICPKWTIVGMS